MASILKTLAIAAGASVAVGLCATPLMQQRGSRRAPRREEAAIIDIEPLLDRLETVERRFDAAKAAPEPVVLTELTRRIEAQDAEIERLRHMVDSKAVELQSRLESDLAERDQKIDERHKTIESRIGERISALETALGDHSASIEALQVRAQESDTNLQRLIVAIERLVERTQPAPAAAPAYSPAAQPPGPTIVPFETHLKEAAARDTVVKEAEAEPELKRSRSALTRIFGMIAMLVIAQVLAS